MIAILEDRKGFRSSMWIDYDKPRLTIRVHPPLLVVEVGDIGCVEPLVAETVEFHFERWLEVHKVALYREVI